MAKIGGLAADLARQASEAALAEARAADVAPKKVEEGWNLPKLGANFRLQEALDKAVVAAAGHMNDRLQSDGIVLNVPQDAQKTGIEVREKATDRLLKAYDTSAFLRLHAAREKRQGVVVDGQV